jgi:hypothetical protein
VQCSAYCPQLLSRNHLPGYSFLNSRNPTVGGGVARPQVDANPGLPLDARVLGLPVGVYWPPEKVRYPVQ